MNGPPVPAGLSSIPSLDAVAEHPELAEALSREVAFRLFLKVQMLATTFALALVHRSNSERASAWEREELINAREAARILNRSLSWIQQRARTAPLKFCLVQSLGRGLLFSRRKIDLLIAREVGQNPEPRTLGLRGVNSGRRPRRKGNADPPSSPASEGKSGEG